jgi:hypothetical protein
MAAKGDTSLILPNNSSKSGISISTPSVLEGVVLCMALCSVNIGIEKAQTRLLELRAFILSMTAMTVDLLNMVMISKFVRV